MAKEAIDVRDARRFFQQQYEEIGEKEGCASDKASFCLAVMDCLLFHFPQGAKCVVGPALALSIITPNGKKVDLVKDHETFNAEGYLGKYHYTYLFRIMVERLNVVKTLMSPPQD